MAARVLLQRLDAEQVAAGLLLNQLRDVLGVAQHLSVHHDTAGSLHRIHAVGFRDGKIGDQDVAARSGQIALLAFAAGRLLCRRIGFIARLGLLRCIAFRCGAFLRRCRLLLGGLGVRGRLGICRLLLSLSLRSGL